MSSILESTVKKAWKETKNTVFQVPEIERKVKEATSNEKWGPHSTQMRELAQATFSFHDLPLIMNTIWRRLNDHGKYWRHVYKSLLLIDYLLHNGSEQVIRECRDHIVAIQTLTEFQYIDERDQDVGLSVRERAKQLVELIHDEKRLKAEREKAKNTSKKFLVGMGSEVGGYEPNYERDNNYERDSGYDRERERDSPGSSNRHSAEPEDYNEEEQQQPPQQRRPSSSNFSSTSTSSANNVRPRAPSGGPTPTPVSNNTTSRSSVPAPSTSQQPTKNIFDMDEVMTSGPSVPSRKQELDFFNMPAQTFNPSGQTRPNPGPSPFQNNTGFDNGFDPRGNTNNSTVPNSEWADFTGSQQQQSQHEEQQNGETSDKKQDAYDPWNQKHLFDLGFDSKDSKTSNTTSTTNKTPMGAMGSKTPMGPPSTTTAKPTMGMNSGMGMNTGVNMGMNPGMNMGMNTTMNPGMGMNTGMNPGMGMNMGMNTTMSPGMNMGMNTMGMNSGMRPGMSPGMGMNTMGMNPGMGMNTMGMNSGMNNSSMGRGTTMNQNPNSNWNPF